VAQASPARSVPPAAEDVNRAAAALPLASAPKPAPGGEKPNESSSFSWAWLIAIMTLGLLSALVALWRKDLLRGIVLKLKRSPG